MVAKDSKETLNKVELRINRVRINRARPVIRTSYAAYLFCTWCKTWP